MKSNVVEKKVFSENFTILRISENNFKNIYLASNIKAAQSREHSHEPEVSLIHRTRRYRIKSLTRALGVGAY